MCNSRRFQRTVNLVVLKLRLLREFNGLASQSEGIRLFEGSILQSSRSSHFYGSLLPYQAIPATWWGWILLDFSMLIAVLIHIITVTIE